MNLTEKSSSAKLISRETEEQHKVVFVLIPFRSHIYLLEGHMNEFKSL